MATTLVAQTPSQGAAKVVRIKGSARYTDGGKSGNRLKSATSLIRAR